MARRARKAAKRTKSKSGSPDWEERLRARLEAEEACLKPKERAARRQRWSATEARVRALAPGWQRVFADLSRVPTVPLAIAEALRDSAPAGDGQSESSTLPVDECVVKITRPKRSTARGEARDKLVAALTEHHRYADESRPFDTTPVAGRELARKAEVSTSTAFTFIKTEFGGREAYRRACGDESKLVAALKLLNGEFAPRHLLLRDVAE